MVNEIKFASGKRETHVEIQVKEFFSYTWNKILWRDVRTEFEKVTDIDIEISLEKKIKLKKSLKQNKNLPFVYAALIASQLQQRRSQNISVLRF